MMIDILHLSKNLQEFGIKDSFSALNKVVKEYLIHI